MKVADMTMDELRDFVRGVVEDVLAQRDDEGPDPDEGLELRPEFVAEMQEALARPRGQGISAEQMRRELGIDR